MLASPPSVSTMAHKQILVVDDNEVCAKVLAQLFTTPKLKELATFQVTVLFSAEDALRNLEIACYDLIFTDIEMTGMSGDAMARMIRESEQEIRNAPIIAVTSKCDDESCIGYKEAGMNYCLAKPPNVESIYNIVREIMTS